MAADVGANVYTTGTYAGTTLASAAQVTAATGSSYMIVAVGLAAGMSFTPTDSKGNTYGLQGSVSSNTSDGISMGAYLATNGIGGSGHTFRLDASTNTAVFWWGVELTGAALSSIVDVLNGANTGFLGNPSNNPVTATLALDLILGWFQDNTNPVTTFTPGSGFSIVLQDLTNGNCFVKQQAGGAAAYDPAVSRAPSGGRTQAFTIALKSATGSFTLTAAAGSYSIAGQNTGLISGFSLAAASGSYSIVGQAATLEINTNVLTLVAAAGTYDLVGADALSIFQLDQGAGVFAISGQNATLTGPGGVKKYGVSSSGTSKSTQAAAAKFFVSGAGTTHDTGTEESLP